MLRIWAVARHTFIEAIRSRMTAIFMLILAGLLLALPHIAASGTPRDRMQTFLDYSLTSSNVLLSVMTVLLACGLIGLDVRKRTIFSTVTKPLSRWRYIVGRWLGLVLLQGMLVACCGAIIYGVCYYLRQQASQAQRAVLDREVFTARHRHFPDPPNVQAQVQARKAEMAKENRLQQAIDSLGGGEAGERAVEMELGRTIEYQLQTAGPPYVAETIDPNSKERVMELLPPLPLRWHFSGLKRPTGPKAEVQLTFKLNPAQSVPDDLLPGLWTMTNPQTGAQGMSRRTGDKTNVPTTITIPAMLISDDGRLDVTFININPVDPRKTYPVHVTIVSKDVSVLYPVGTFTPNFLRAMILLFCVQAFLAAMGLVAGSFLSFPVACLACFGLLVIGMASSFAMDTTAVYVDGIWTLLGYYSSRGVLIFLPNFVSASPTEAMVDGLEISWQRVLGTVGTFIFIQSTIALVLASAIFTKRELAQVTA